MKLPTQQGTASCSHAPTAQLPTFVPLFSHVSEDKYQRYTLDELSVVLPHESFETIMATSEAQGKGQAYLVGCYYGD